MTIIDPCHTSRMICCLQRNVRRRERQQRNENDVRADGSMVAEGPGGDDPEGAMLESVRQLVGPCTPVVVSLDL